MKKRFLFPILAGALCGSAMLAPGQAPAPAAPQSEVALEVDGARITLAELERQRPAALFQARNTLYQAERKIATEFADDYLLDRQAKREGLSVEALLEKHVDSKLPPDPSEESLRVYYEGLEISDQPFEAVRDQIIAHLRQARKAKLKAAYIASLRKQANITVRLAPPRTTVNMKDALVRGNADAPVVMVEYADYECPYCQNVQPALDQLAAEYKGRVAFVFKDMPLPIHKKAAKAAEAARCAAAQGRFWEYHDLLMSKKELEFAQLKQHAQALKLDSTRFDKCLDSGEQSKLVQSEFEEARALGIQGTPTFIINGRLETGNLTYEQLRAIVEEEMAAKKSSLTNTALR